MLTAIFFVAVLCVGIELGHAGSLRKMRESIETDFAAVHDRLKELAEKL